VHAVPAKSQAPRLSCLGACVFGVQHARPLWSSKRGPVSARQPRGQTYVRILGATKCPAFWPFGSTRPSLRDHNFAKVGELELDKRQARSNDYGLESAKPDLQSTFKKPGGDTAAA